MAKHPLAETLKQPGRSTAILERHANGLSLMIPSLGLRRGGGFLFWWAVPWNLMCIPMAVVVWYEAFSGAPVFDGAPATFLWYLFPLPFLFAGAVTLLIVLHLGWRRAAFAVVGDTLSVMHVGLFATRRGEWAREQLAAIGTGPSGIEENDRPILELQIHPREGPKFNLLAKRNVAELKWIAAVLRRELDLPEEPPETVPPAPVRGTSTGDGDPPVTAKAAKVGSSYAWIGSGIAAAIAFTVFWFVINYSWTVNGVGILQRLGWPWSKFYLCAAGGAGLGCAGGLLHLARQRRHAREVAELCESMGFTYAPVVSRPELSDYSNLRLFKKWSAASNRMSGRSDGLRMEMLDYTYVEKGSEESTSYRQTVLLLPAGAEELPAFELRPRHFGVKMLGLIGVEGLTFRSEAAASDADRDAIERFGRQYHLSEGLDVLVEAMARKAAAETGEEEEPVPERGQGEEAIRRLFTLDVLRFFAGHPGWYVQSDGKHLAIWRRNAIVRAASRPGFLADGLEVRQAFMRLGTRADHIPVAAGTAGIDPTRLSARLMGTLAGCFVGFFTGGILGSMAAMRRDPFQGGFAGSALLFFGGTILGLIVGAVVGNRLLYYPIYHFLHARHARRRPPSA